MMVKDRRTGERILLNEPCEVRYTVLSEKSRHHELDVMNLSSNAIALKIPRDHEITRDYHELINGPALLHHEAWASNPELDNWRRGFLSLARYINSRSWKWVLFFDRKYPLSQLES